MKRIGNIMLLAIVSAVWSVTPTVKADSDSEGLKTKHGTLLKLIVREPAAMHERPDASSLSRPVDQFQFFYVLPTTNNGQEKVQNGFYRIATAPRFSAHAGWIAKDAVVEWPHVQVMGFRPQAGRQRILFFGHQASAEKWYKGDDSVQPISREPAQVLGRVLFPLLDVSQFEHKGDKIDLYQLAYLHRLSVTANATPSKDQADESAVEGTKEKPSTEVTRTQLERDFTLQVVFVLDTTQSMQPFIDAAKKVIATIVDELSKDPALRGRVQFGLVCFRDKLKDEEANRKMEYVVKMVCNLKDGADHKEFQRRLEPIREATISSEDVPEDMLAALKKAVQEGGWSKAAYKHLIAISDASFQIDRDSYKNIEHLTIPGFLAMAQPTGSEVWSKIQIHGLRIISHHSSDHQRCKEHFEQLTAGVDLPGLHYQFAGKDDAPKFVEHLTSRLLQLSGYTAKIVEGKGQDLLQEAKQAAPGSDRYKLFLPIVEMLQRTDEKAPTGSAAFAQGFAAVLDRDGNRALEAHVFVTHGRLSLFASALDFSIRALEDAGEAGNRDVQKVVSSLQIIATQVNLGENVTADLPLTKLLSTFLGFPVRNPIFTKTPAQLAAMSTADYQKWVQQIRASESIVKSHLENGEIWFFLGQKPGKPQDRHAFIRVSDLP